MQTGGGRWGAARVPLAIFVKSFVNENAIKL
jgi:hypothetical protein